MKPDSVAVVIFSGELDISRYPEIHGGFQDRPAAPHILIDLSGASYVDSVYLTELLLFARNRGQRGATTLIQAEGNVARILTLAGVDRRIRVVSNREAAMKIFAQSPGPLKKKNGNGNGDENGNGHEEAEGTGAAPAEA